MASTVRALVGRAFDLRFGVPLPTAGPNPGRWRLVYTDALDVLGLDASPFRRSGPSTSPSRYGTVTNEIRYTRGGLLPTSAFLPDGSLTVATLKVQTRARARGCAWASPLIHLIRRPDLPRDVTSLLPQLSAPLPRLPGAGGADSDDSPAYFDIVYLDIDTLIIRQNDPGGVFVAIRDDDDFDGVGR